MLLQYNFLKKSLFCIIFYAVIANLVFLIGCASMKEARRIEEAKKREEAQKLKEIKRIEDLKGINIQYIRSYALSETQPLIHILRMQYVWEGTPLKAGERYLYKSEHQTTGPIVVRYAVPIIKGEEIKSDVPEAGNIYVIVLMKFENLSENELIIKNSDINLVDDMGEKWPGNFWTPLESGIWNGVEILATKSKKKVVSYTKPDIELNMIDSVMFFGSKEAYHTSEIAGDSIRMLFEVPESKFKGLKLMFLDKIVTPIMSKKIKACEYECEEMFESGELKKGVSSEECIKASCIGAPQVSSQTEGEQRGVSTEKLSQEQTQPKEAPTDYGIVSITSDPPGAKIFINGEHKGVTPAEISLTTGTHQLFLQREPYEPYKDSVTIEKGQAKTLNIRLSPEGGEQK